MKRVQGKSIIITGASLGIGRAAAILCAQEGAQVAVTDINEEEGNKVVQEIQENKGQAKFWYMNTADEKQVQEIFGAVDNEFGKIDVLVNNAGIAGVNKPTHEISEQEWDALMAVNVKGVFFCTKHAIPYLKCTGGGSIINISSIYGIIGAADLPPYHASKGAVRLMTKTDAMLYAKDKIRVNSIHPGYIWTPLVEKLGQGYPEGITAFREHIDSLHPIGHAGEPNDIGYGILYLASDESKFMTGSELIIDGGYTTA